MKITEHKHFSGAHSVPGSIPSVSLMINTETGAPNGEETCQQLASV